MVWGHSEEIDIEMVWTCVEERYWEYQEQGVAQEQHVEYRVGR